MNTDPNSRRGDARWLDYLSHTRRCVPQNVMSDVAPCCGRHYALREKRLEHVRGGSVRKQHGSKRSWQDLEWRTFKHQVDANCNYDSIRARIVCGSLAKLEFSWQRNRIVNHIVTFTFCVPSREQRDAHPVASAVSSCIRWRGRIRQRTLVNILHCMFRIVDIF